MKIDIDSANLIEGVKIKILRPILDERGRLMEILRSDDPIFVKFGQIYLTTVYHGVVKAWHCHRRQIDNLSCIRGVVKLALYDAREDSITYGKINEFFMGDNSPLLIQIPPLVYHGMKGVGAWESLVINCPTEPYNHDDPDEVRLSPDTPEIPYDWKRRDG